MTTILAIYRLLVYFSVFSCKVEVVRFAKVRCYCNKYHRKEGAMEFSSVIKAKDGETQNLQVCVRKSWDKRIASFALGSWWRWNFSCLQGSDSLEVRKPKPVASFSPGRLWQNGDQREINCLLSSPRSSLSKEIQVSEGGSFRKLGVNSS